MIEFTIIWIIAFGIIAMVLAEISFWSGRIGFLQVRAREVFIGGCMMLVFLGVTHDSSRWTPYKWSLMVMAATLPIALYLGWMLNVDGNIPRARYFRWAAVFYGMTYARSWSRRISQLPSITLAWSRDCWD